MGTVIYSGESQGILEMAALRAASLEVDQYYLSYYIQSVSRSADLGPPFDTTPILLRANPISRKYRSTSIRPCVYYMSPRWWRQEKAPVYQHVKIERSMELSSVCGSRRM